MTHEIEVKDAIVYFNRIAGTKFRTSGCGETLDVLIGTYGYTNIIEKMKAYINDGKEKDIYKFCQDVQFEEYAKAKYGNSQVQTNDVGAALNLISTLVSNQISNIKADQIKDSVTDKIEQRIDEYIHETYGNITKKVTLISEFGEHKVEGITHRVFDTVLKMTANGIGVYLYGPAGSGKNVICKQVADALGIDFYFTNAVTQEYKLTGFTDANGVYRESSFYKAFKNGGLFMLDEMDASIPEVLIILNAALANGYFDFPAPIGKVYANKNFRVIAAGNTLGHGSNSEYTGRNIIDGASLDRFLPVRVDYDSRIEDSVSNNDNELVNFCRAFRKASNEAGLHIIVSYRAISNMAKLKGVIDYKTIVDSCLIKGLERDDICIIKKNLGNNYGVYTQAIDEILKELT